MEHCQIPIFERLAFGVLLFTDMPNEIGVYPAIEDDKSRLKPRMTPQRFNLALQLRRVRMGQNTHQNLHQIHRLQTSSWNPSGSFRRGTSRPAGGPERSEARARNARVARVTPPVGGVTEAAGPE